jgi:hypothetical protein
MTSIKIPIKLVAEIPQNKKAKKKATNPVKRLVMKVRISNTSISRWKYFVLPKNFG